MDQKTNDFLESLKKQITDFQSEVTTPPIIGNTVATDAADLMGKVQALGPTTGDYTIGVKDGHHAPIKLSKVNIGGKLTIVAENRRGVKFDRITIDGGSTDVKLLGLGSCPVGDATAGGLGNVKQYGITADTSTARIEVEEAFCQGHVDSVNHAYWTLAEWRARGMGAVFLQGVDSAARKIYGEGVRFGVNLVGDRSIAEDCYIVGLSGDGFRGAAHDLTFRRCMASDLVYMNDGNHPDGLQVFIVQNGVNVTVRNLNVEMLALFDWTVRYDNPLRFAYDKVTSNPNMARWGRMQGIGMHQTKFLNPSLVDIYIRTPIANGIHIGGTDGLYGRRWNVLNSDLGLPLLNPTNPNNSLSYDKRFPKINVNASAANNPVDVDDIVAEDIVGNIVGQATNARIVDGGAPDYLDPKPSWISDIMASVA